MVEVIRGDFLSSCDIWCSILVYHYLFAVCALLVSLVVCCAACLLIMRYRANNSPFLLLVVHIRQRAWFYMLLCSARSKIEVIRIKQTAFHFERLKLCLISAVVVLLVQIWRYYLPRSCFSCVVVGRFCLSMYEVIRLGYFIGFHLLIWNVDTYTIDMWFVVVVVIVDTLI